MHHMLSLWKLSEILRQYSSMHLYVMLTACYSCISTEW